MDEIETINIKLEHSVAKLLSEKELLHKEIKHLKKIYKDQFYSIKKTRVLFKEHCKSLIAHLNSKSMENVYLKGMFNLDLDPLAPRLLKNRNAHINYLKYTQDQADILQRIVKQAKAKKPLDNTLDFAPNHPWESNATDVPSSSSLVNDSKFLRTVRFRNDQISKIMGYDDYQLRNVTILRLAKDGLARGIPKVKFKKDHMCLACALGKSKKSSHQPKTEATNQEKLYLLHMDLCRPMHVESINGKKYILVIVDDYSRFTWVKFLRSKDEAPDTIIKCIKNIQVRLNATVCNVRTDNGTGFVNQMLREFYENISISHQTSIAHTP
ncbi:ribonuclease H-like domain-containing protein [Tanacetum coccineum]|uniref:Ribonuclease H-like domain-containing protein n=1 Tax=Tanacetum coccineum TaxID=301880 RepID=A0ABQ5ISJ1_9ASTR